MREMTVEDVARRLGQPRFFVYDNNGPSRYARSHVPGAKHLDPASYPASALPSDKGATLVFYCSGPG